jgi:hypothetical protein
MTMREKATDNTLGITNEAGIFSGELPAVKRSGKEHNVVYLA